ncbi:MAG: peptidoglycan bridge formation glycyltransferase FemA/FemB family protein [Candidatus Lokiarchaeota archaeon]|nr:peptidoglycan bridge formation glycyltransferase FemA/FemB family protein [Candidatus Lokiarchaeota archaeon]
MSNFNKYTLVEEINLNKSKFQVWHSTLPDDAEWNSFVLSVDSGRHEQTSMWANVKALSGWSFVRIIISEDEKIIGGFQTLLKRKKVVGRIGYISHGPILVVDSYEISKILINQIINVCKNFDINAVIISFPAFQKLNYNSQMFAPNILFPVIKGSLLINLNLSEEKIFGNMRNSVKRNIRKALKSGLKFSEGNFSELPIFFDLMIHTCKRQGVNPNPENLDTVYKIWKMFSKYNSLRLFFCKVNNEIVNSYLCLTYGKTFLAWKVGWNGKKSEIKPNDGLYWYLIKFAKMEGYQFFDFGSVDLEIAEKIKRKIKLDKSDMSSSSFIKIGFGGEIIEYPEAVIYFKNYVFRTVYKHFVKIYKCFNKHIHR